MVDQLETVEVGAAAAEGAVEAEVPLEVLERRLVSWASNIAAAQARWLVSLAEYDRREGWASWGCVSAVQWLSWKCGLSPNAARERVRVASALEDLPEIGGLFLAGRVSYSKVRAVTRVANEFNEDQFADLAVNATGSQLETICRAYRATKPDDGEAAAAFERRRWVSRVNEDGTTSISLRLTDDDARLANEAIDAEIDALIADALEAGDAESRREFIEGRGGIAALRSDAAIALMIGQSHATGPVAAEVTLVVGEDHPNHPPAPETSAAVPAETCDAAAGGVSAETCDAAAGGVSAETCDAAAGGVSAETWGAATDPAGGGVSAETPAVLSRLRYSWTADDVPLSRPVAERLCCDPRISVLVEDANCRPLGVGRATRVINRRLRRALERRDGGCCQFPGCSARRWLHAHHIIHWANGGPTELDNLILVCHFHHHLVHEGGWNIRRSDRAFLAPTGQLVDPIPAVAHLRGNADAVDHLGPDDDRLIAPYDPLHLGWVVGIIHDNEWVARQRAAGAWAGQAH